MKWRADKTLAEAYYGKPIQYSYWNSCHNGGNQGLNEAQRYPTILTELLPAIPLLIFSLAAGFSVHQLGRSQGWSQWLPDIFRAPRLTC